jgi:hypothetical protein
VHRYSRAVGIALIIVFLSTPWSRVAAQSDDEDFEERYFECSERFIEPVSSQVRSRNELVVAARVVDGECGTTQLVLSQRTKADSVGISVVIADYTNTMPERSKSRFMAWSSRAPNCEMIWEGEYRGNRHMQLQLRERVSELRRLAISPVLEPTLHLEGLHYQLTISSIHAESLYRFTAPGHPRPPSVELQPLDAWIQDVFALLRISCEPDVSPAVGGPLHP